MTYGGGGAEGERGEGGDGKLMEISWDDGDDC